MMEVIQFQKRKKVWSLGQLLDVLENYKDYEINLQEPHCYRGNYNHLAFVTDYYISVDEFIQNINKRIKEPFYSYKAHREIMLYYDSKLWVVDEKDEASNSPLIGLKCTDKHIFPIVYSDNYDSDKDSDNEYEINKDTMSDDE